MTIRRKKETPVESLENSEAIEQGSDEVKVLDPSSEKDTPETIICLETTTLELELSNTETSLAQQPENLRRRPEPLAKARPRRNSPKFSPKLK